MKNSTSLLLLCAFLTASLAACGGDSTDTQNTTALSETKAAVTEEAAVKYEPDDLPEDLDFGGEVIHTFCRITDLPDFTVEEEDGDIVNDAIYQRNRTVEERLNVDLTFTQIDGGNYDRAEWVKTVTASTMAGDGANDIVAGYSMCLPVLAVDGMLLNLNNYEALNFDKPWWPKSLTEEATIEDKLFFCSGDISTNMIYYLYGVYFNKSFISTYDLENPYDLVREGRWTLDTLFSICSELYSDLNGDGNKDGNDQFGFITDNVYSDAFLFAGGLTTTRKDENNIPYISPDFGGERTQALLTRWVDAFQTNNGMLLVDGGSEYPFVENRAMFYAAEFIFGVTKLRETNMDYGILPLPKYDEAQAEYYTISSFPYNLFGIPVDAKNPETSAAVIECLASESYRTVSPMLFETALKVKYASDSEISEMYDIIRASNMFDFGRVFNDCMNGQTYTLFRDALFKGNTNWISIFTKKEKSLNKFLTKIVDALTALE